MFGRRSIECIATGYKPLEGRATMRTTVLKWTSIVLAALLIGFVQKPQAQTRVNISMFYSTLAPHGEWIDYQDYGLCWRPTVVEAGWRPYTHGRWAWTDYGWTWASDYSWGWAPFHYGRWVYDDYYGWIWVPDDVWGPAWVDWRFSDAYIGWAPLPPAAHFRLGIGLALGGYVIPQFAWSFTFGHGFLGSRLAILPYRQNVVLLRRTHRIDGLTFRNNRVYNVGPRVGFVERATGSRVRKSVIIDRRDFGERRGSAIEGDRLYLHRPNFDRPREEKPRVEGGQQGRQGRVGQGERRSGEIRTPTQERPATPELRNRGERKSQPKTPENSGRGRSERGERPSRGR
jgi:hypothetical protein